MRNIAVVDDNDSELKILKAMAEEAGLNVIATGSNGQDAVEICAAGLPELIIMDYKMPVKDGIEAAIEISKTCPTAIVLLTAYDDEKSIHTAAEAGVMAYLVKPVRQEQILPAVEVALSRFKEFEALRKENAALKDAVEARKIIEKAKGLLMEKEGLNENEAFVRIRKMSMDRRKDMKEIALTLIAALEGKDKRTAVGKGL